MERPRVLIMGKLPPPVMGPAIATQIILNSDLNSDFDLIHFDTRINATVADMGRLKWSKFSLMRKKYKAFKKVLETEKPDLVLVPISQTTMGFLKDAPFIRMAASAGVSVLLQLRGSAFKSWYDGLKSPLKGFVKKTVQRAQGVVVLGENLRYLFRGFYPEKNIYVVPNGGDYCFPARKENALRVIYLANYLPGKGIKEVLLGLQILAEKAELEFEFHAYGSWDNAEYEAACKTIVAQDIMKKCFLHGPVQGDEKWQVLADADVFVFTPNSPEGHPWSIVEAMAASLPIIATDRGAICQSVKDQVNGYLLKDPKPAEIADCISMLVKDDALRNKLAKASREGYEAEFTAARMTASLGKVFNQILESQCVE